MTLTHASAFTGIGGFDLGFEAAGMTTVHQTEKDSSCQQVLTRTWPNVPKGRDICDVRGTDLGAPDIFSGGFPCQDTSIAAPHRSGLAGRRSGLFFEFTRLLEEHLRLVDASRPRWVVIENPEGLLRSPGKCRAKSPCYPGCTCGTDRTGWDLAAVIRGLEELGYGWAYRVVDGRHLGTAQRRRRVLVVGHRGGDPGPAWRVLGDTDTGGSAADPRPVGRGQGRPQAVPGAVGGSEALIWRKSARARAAISAGGYETWVASEDANTLTGFDGGGVNRQTHLIAQHGRIRTLTLTEWERLQGFPDGHTAGLSDSARFTALGNAMCVPMAAWLGRRLVSVDASLPIHIY